MMKISKHHLMLAAAGMFALAAAGCVSDKSSSSSTEVSKDAAFLGYSNPDTKQTTCGNCHTDVQAEWVQTKHANAWADLQASGHASASCNECHTTNGATNGAADSAGFFAMTNDASRKFYQDVQCEACHGPGANHVSAPGETQPLPIMAVDTAHKNGCAACHYGTHDDFQEQLSASKHGRMPNWEGAAGSCQVNCHSGYGAIAIYNPRFTYPDQKPATDLTSPNPGLTCVVCHDPHDATNPGQTRLTLNTTDSAQHLCGKCHNRGPVGNAASGSWKSSRGGHSAQFATLMGYSGYQFTNTVTGPARHGSIEGSCAACHMNAAPVMNGSTFVVQNTGHTFMPAPCIDPSKVSTGGVDTAEACAESARDFSACATSNCHGSQTAAYNAMNALQTEIQGYANVLWKDKNGNATIDAFPTDSGWIPLLLAHESRFAAGSKRLATSGADTVFTVAKAARFNVLTLANPTKHGDGSLGVHNPAYVRSMFRQTLAQVWAAYGATDTLPAAPASVRAFLNAPARR